MITTVSAGDLGLDVLLGGGLRLVERVPDKQSATVVVRGGSGAGKTILGFHVALELARALGGDVAVGCVEILPREYIAQLRSARPTLDPRRVTEVTLPPETDEGPQVFVALLPDMDPNAPDLVAALESLAKDVEATGGKPVAFIVDSLIEGYGIGSSAPRVEADALMKFAAQGGYGLVCCEEVVSDTPSPWVFAADTVLELGVESRERGRWIEVRKHRFGPCAPGRHELDLVGRDHPEAFPAPSAWLTPAVEGVLRHYGWQFGGAEELPQFVAYGPLERLFRRGLLRGELVFVTSSIAQLARNVATTLLTEAEPSAPTLLIELDPLATADRSWSVRSMEVRYVAASLSAARGLRRIIGWFGDLVRTPAPPALDRVVVGDLGLLLTGPAATEWTDAVTSFAAIASRTGRGIPVILYDWCASPDTALRARLTSVADLSIAISEFDGINVNAVINQRFPPHSVSASVEREKFRATEGRMTAGALSRGQGADQ